MRTSNSDFPEIKIIHLDQYMDERGMFAETYDRRTFSALGIDIDFVQDSCSFSIARGTVRGLHFQIPPFAQHKLVRVTHGRIFDVVVDLRSGSSTFGQHVSFELDASSWCHILVPIGFAHGF